jgi:hypothetical protein
MASDDFTPEEIAEMIAEEGQAVLLSITTADEYVPGSGVSGGTPVEVMTMGVLLPFSRGLRALPNSGIDSRDQQLLLAGDIPKPTLSTTLAVGGDVYSIIEVNPLAPKGVDLFYDCTVRGAQ